MEVEIARKSLQKLERDVLRSIRLYEDSSGMYVSRMHLRFAPQPDGTRRTDGVKFEASLETPDPEAASKEGKKDG